MFILFYFLNFTIYFCLPSANYNWKSKLFIRLLTDLARSLCCFSFTAASIWNFKMVDCKLFSILKLFLTSIGLLTFYVKFLLVFFMVLLMVFIMVFPIVLLVVFSIIFPVLFLMMFLMMLFMMLDMMFLMVVLCFCMFILLCLMFIITLRYFSTTVTICCIIKNAALFIW